MQLVLCSYEYQQAVRMRDKALRLKGEMTSYLYFRITIGDLRPDTL